MIEEEKNKNDICTISDDAEEDEQCIIADKWEILRMCVICAVFALEAVCAVSIAYFTVSLSLSYAYSMNSGVPEIDVACPPKLEDSRQLDELRHRDINSVSVAIYKTDEMFRAHVSLSQYDSIDDHVYGFIKTFLPDEIDFDLQALFQMDDQLMDEGLTYHDSVHAHCQLGSSRSRFAVAAYLYASDFWTEEDALFYMRSNRNSIYCAQLICSWTKVTYPQHTQTMSEERVNRLPEAVAVPVSEEDSTSFFDSLFK